MLSKMDLIPIVFVSVLIIAPIFLFVQAVSERHISLVASSAMNIIYASVMMKIIVEWIRNE